MREDNGDLLLVVWKTTEVQENNCSIVLAILKPI